MVRRTPINNTIIEGLWKSDKENNLKYHWTIKLQKDLNIKIGDTFTFNIYGNTALVLFQTLEK